MIFFKRYFVPALYRARWWKGWSLADTTAGSGSWRANVSSAANITDRRNTVLPSWGTELSRQRRTVRICVLTLDRLRRDHGGYTSQKRGGSWISAHGILTPSRLKNVQEANAACSAFTAHLHLGDALVPPIGHLSLRHPHQTLFSTNPHLPPAPQFIYMFIKSQARKHFK